MFSPENYSTWLVVLKFLGLALAAGSSIWGTLTVLTVTTPAGRKQLTRAGAVAIGLTLFGLSISIVSEDLQRRKAAADQVKQIAAEAARTNEIIIAGQPLASLSLRLAFSNKDPVLWDIMKEGEEAIEENAYTSQGGVPATPFEVVEYEAILSPLLTYMGRLGQPLESVAAPEDPSDSTDSPSPDGSVLALIALDESENTILSFGNVPGGLSTLPAGFDPLHDTGSSPYVYRVLAEGKGTDVSSYHIIWVLDPVALAASVQRQNEKIESTARLPDTMRVVIFYDIGTLPFAHNNFTRSDSSFWTSDNEISFELLGDATLTASVNGISTRHYALKHAYAVELDLYDEFDEFQDYNTGCTLLEFELQKEDAVPVAVS
jgi:hypothetical protein